MKWFISVKDGVATHVNENKARTFSLRRGYASNFKR